MSYNLWKVFGLQRSGNHAIINWLMGLDQENTLFFNKRKPGVDLLENPSGVSLPDGHKSYANRVSGKKVINENLVEEFKNRGDMWNLLVSYENYDIGEFDENLLNAPITKVFGNFCQSYNFLVIRNPFSMISSTERMLRNTMKKRRKKKMNVIDRIRLSDDQFIEQILHKRAEIWRNYAFLCLYPDSPTRGRFIPIIFDKWIEDREYRDRLAESVGYRNTDQFIDFVSDAGKGSSFEGMDLENNHNTLSRWDQGNKEFCKKVLLDHLEFIDYASIIFGNYAIPQDMQSYFD